LIVNKRTDIKVGIKSDIKAAVTAAFSAAAETYDDCAQAQRAIAANLALRLDTLALSNARILEIGCGTGFLSRHLMSLHARELILSDISTAMVEGCRARVGHAAGVRYVVLDGEDTGTIGSGFDLICSSLAFQWFGDLRAACHALAGQLAPGGYLAFSTLACGTFHEWREAHTALGLEPALRTYPSLQSIARVLPANGVLDIHEEHHRRRYRDGHAFIAELKQIGAHLPEDTSRALTPGALRRVLRSVEDGIDATYHVASVIWRKP